jgi:SAM-dependent methyltransferase
MFELAGVGPGARVLDLGTGTGDTALFASARVGPTGHVLATDASPSMVQVASEAVGAAGAANVSVRVMSADRIDVDEAAFDAVIARLVLMYIEDLAGTLAGVRRGLRPGGRFACVVWASLERNPFHRAVIEAALAHGPLPDPPPELVRAYSLPEPEMLLDGLGRAGFAEPRVRRVACTRRFGSTGDAVASAKDSPVLAAVFRALDEGAQSLAWARVSASYDAFASESGVSIPGELLVASGARPPTAPV